MITIYDLIGYIQNMDNMDKLDEIISRWYFQTPVWTSQVKEEVKKAVVEILQLGEPKVYQFFVDMYGLKM
ncbi:hypothetical protein GS458_0315 [Geobacillus stearothermophilus]|nr:hypothetical protein GS458_0315 [Geobacillus stearothermophilus]